MEKLVYSLIKSQTNLSDSTIKSIFKESKIKKIDPVELLYRKGLIDEHKMIKFYCSILDIPFFENEDINISEELLKFASMEFWKGNHLLPIYIEKGILYVLSDKWDNFERLDYLANFINMPVELILTTSSRLRECLEKIDKNKQVSVEELWELSLNDYNEEDIIEQFSIDNSFNDKSSPVIRFINYLLIKAIDSDASDIHIEPSEKSLRVRMRVDGILMDIFSPPKQLHKPIMNRIKIMAKLQLAEYRKPQEGRIPIKYKDDRIDIRVSIIPTSDGERAVLRILNQSAHLLRLEQLGMDDEQLETFRSLLNRNYGMILVTGPTGSGKTTTLYASIQEINSPDKNIITIEDPVEYKIKGINQLSVNRATGFTFAEGLRAILRQDPDVILIGEIRDSETANIAIQASMTGHLVLSTMHTTNAFSAINRLLDLKVDNYKISDALICVLAQRLVRLTCNFCRQPYTPHQHILKSFHHLPNFKEAKFFSKGMGCPYCLNTGYKGRTGIFELFVIEDWVKDFIKNPSPSIDIEKIARKKGITTLEEDGWRKVAMGLTTPDELYRIIKTK